MKKNKQLHESEERAFMKATLKWTEGMKFDTACDGNSLVMDAKAPLGASQGMTPKELVAAGLGGCTAMDVVALLKKHKQLQESLEVEVNVTSSSGVHPAVFTEAEVRFLVTGPVDKEILLNSVKLSQTKFCGVSAMLCKAFPIRYKVILNGEEIGSGNAHFES